MLPKFNVYVMISPATAFVLLAVFVIHKSWVDTTCVFSIKVKNGAVPYAGVVNSILFSMVVFGVTLSFTFTMTLKVVRPAGRLLNVHLLFPVNV